MIPVSNVSRTILDGTDSLDWYINNSIRMDVFGTAFLPNTSYIHHLIKSTHPVIDLGEHFIKQTYRNRTFVLSANGPISIIVPLRKTDSRHSKDVEISYAEDWQKKCLKAIQSSYKNSPYYEHYQHEFESLLMANEPLLYQYNKSLLNWILRQLDIEMEVLYSLDYVEAGIQKDYRAVDFYSNEYAINRNYKQVFSYKTDFVDQLSAIDLLFNKGPEAFIYLK